MGALVLRLHRDRAELTRLLAAATGGVADEPHPGSPSAPPPDPSSASGRDGPQDQSEASADSAPHRSVRPSKTTAASEPVPEAVRQAVDDILWAKTAALLRDAAPAARPTGPKRHGDRAVLAAIVHVLRTGTAWEALDRDRFGCAGSTAWHRLRGWQRAGVWAPVRALLVDHLHDARDIDWARAPAEAPPEGPRRRRRRRRG